MPMFKVKSFHIELVDHAISNWALRPQMTIDDAYKWLHQATLGNEHAITNIDDARLYLEKEWNNLGENSISDEEWEPLRPDGKIGRLHLRPFQGNGRDRDRLFYAFLKSADLIEKNYDLFHSVWQELGKRSFATPIVGIYRENWEELDSRLGKMDYPAIHHSKTYANEYRPSYRVLEVGEMRTLYADCV